MRLSLVLSVNLPARLSDSLVPVSLHAMRRAALGLPALPVPAPLSVSLPASVLAVRVRHCYGKTTIRACDLPRRLDEFA